MLDYSTVTETVGEFVSREAAEMMHDRYQFVATRIDGNDILEVSCGAGFGLGYTAKHARRVVGADITLKSLRAARRHYRVRVPLVQCDAQALPFPDRSFDAVAIHEAIYYYDDHDRAFCEARRVLRDNGRLFISTINPEWTQFNPSPFSTSYLSARQLAEALGRRFDRVELFGAFPAAVEGNRARVFAAIKRRAVEWRLMPKTMRGKRLLKRLVFGKLVPVPAELAGDGPPPRAHRLSPDDARAPEFKVIYAVAHRAQGAP